MEKICGLKLNNITKKSKANLLSIFALSISLTENIAIDNSLYINFGKNT